jgi:transposase-like protein
MELNLHANATTTPKTRAYIQRSKKSAAQLAAELGVSETTIYRWRDRTTVEDRSHRPNNLVTSLSAVEERAVCELRTSLQLPLDDIVEVMQRCINAKLSRSAIHRCLQRNGISRLAKPDKPKAGIFETASIGFIHIDVKYLPALQRRISYAFVAIDRATRYVFVEIHSRRDGATATGFLKRFLADFPHDVHTILTDNGAEFTDRFAVDKKNKPPGKPSGDHPFDRLCKQRGIEHRLTRPYHPQTNGLVERFNRRIAEAIGREEKRGSARRTFVDHADRDAFIAKFVHDYNRTRLKCLGYQAPIHALANLTGPNTNAGTHNHGTLCCAKGVQQHHSTIGRGVWVPAFAGTTFRENGVIACDKRGAFAQGSAATKQSILSLRGEMDCFACARNDGTGCLKLWKGQRPCSGKCPKRSPRSQGDPWPQKAAAGTIFTGCQCLAGELGFEPRQTESESVVLPLHHSPILPNKFNHLVICEAIA